MNFTHNFVDTPKVDLVELPEGRRYLTPNGDLYKSVTTFIGENWDKSFLDKWKKKIGENKAASESLRATDRGSYLHKTCEKYLLNDEIEYKKALNDDILNKLLFLKIKPELNKISNIRCIEKSLYSDELRLAGTPDIIADYDGVFSTIDLKGSGKEKLEEYITTYWIQVAIYSRMYAELFGVMPQQSVIIMAVEDSPAPSVFIESSFKGQLRLNEFIDDPVGFQKRLEATKKVKKK